MNLIFLGPPGAGKGTQAALLSEKFSLLHLSTGDILRSAVANKTALGLLVENILNEGGLVDDDIVNQLVAESINNLDRKQGFILDGYPRTVDQAKALDSLLLNTGRSLQAVFAFEVDFSLLLDRVRARAASQKQTGAVRQDDTEEVLQTRLNNYEKQTAPLLSFYEKQDILKRINAMLSIEEVFSSIIDKLKG